jgi:hypothetical protein
MSTSSDSKARYQRAFVPTTALAKRVDFDELTMQVTITDGRVLSVPLSWFPLLREATAQQRANYEIGGGGVSLHWPDIDEDLSIAGLMAGVDPNAGCYPLNARCRPHDLKLLWQTTIHRVANLAAASPSTTIRSAANGEVDILFNNSGIE